MQKYFTKEISQSIKVIVLGLAIGLGVSFVSANWTAPVGTAPDCTSGNPGCDAPINVSTTEQSKGGAPILGITHNVYGTSAADSLVGFSSLTAGTLSGSIPDDKINFFGALTINKSNYTGGRGRDLLNLKGSPDNTSVGIIQNKPNFFIWDYSSNKRGSVQALNADLDGRLRVGEGSPTNGKILAAYNGNGDANWGTIGGGGLDIVVVGHKRGVTNMDEFGTEAFCPSDHPMLLGGGGDCQSPAAIRQSMPITNGHGAFSEGNNSDVVSSEGGQSGWYTNCKMPSSSSNHDVHAWAICAKSVAPTVTVAALPAPAAPVQKWRSIGPDGVPGQTCLALAGVTTTSEIRLKKNDNGATTYITDGSCYYESINSTQSNPIINNFAATYSSSLWYPVGQVQGLAPNGYDYTLEAFKY